MKPFKFDFRDIFRAPRLAFSVQRMWIQMLGMTAGYVGYLILTYLSLIANNFSFTEIWRKFGLLPCLFAGSGSPPWYSWLIYGVGALFLLFAYLITNTAVARAAYKVGKGNNFYSWREAFAFAWRKTGSVILTPVSLVVIIGLMILGAAVLGLLGQIKFVGALGISILTPIWFFCALMMIFFGIVALISLILAPSIIATTDEDAFEAVFQSFSLTWSQPMRLIFYEVITVALSLVSIAVFAFFTKQAVLIMNAMLSSFMGSNYINLATNGQALLQGWLLMAENTVEAIFYELTPYIYYSHEFIKIPASELSSTVVLSSYFFAIGLLFIAGWVLSYGISTFTIGNMISYIAIRKQKDDENLLERKDKEEEEEEEGAELSESDVVKDSTEDKNDES